MQLHLLRVGLIIGFLSVLVSGCGNEVTGSSPDILGRWEVINNQGVSVPNSFFWFVIDYVEFRDDGTVLGLMGWPPDGGSEIRLNKTAEYSLVNEHQIEFVGDCRHQGPCTGVYTITLKEDRLQIFDADGTLDLKRIAPPSKDLPPTAIGPSPSPTPAVIE